VSCHIRQASNTPGTEADQSQAAQQQTLGCMT